MVCLGFVVVMTLTLARTARAQAAPGWEEVSGDTMLVAIQDLDLDGITDLRESLLGTNPEAADSDDDGFSDLFEDQYEEFGFDALVRSRDVDRDGVEDSYEEALGTSSETPDSDEDGLTDFDETMNRRYGYDPTVPTADSDFDGLTDDYEAELGTSPMDPDTDHDGASDFEEVTAGLDPLRPQEGGFGELIGRTYSDEMAVALLNMRKGLPFPPDLAGELPYPLVTGRFIDDPRKANGNPTLKASVSAAIIQSGVYQNILSPYLTYDTIVQQLQAIADKYDGAPNKRLVRLFRWSEPTAQGRYVYAVKISDNPQLNEVEREAMFMGVHHARELITGSITMAWIRKLTDGYAAGDSDVVALVDESEIWVIPVLNPDGYSRAVSEHNSGGNTMWRKNLRKTAEFTYPQGVDLNRNYGFEHVTSLTQAERAAMLHKESNGLYPNGSLNAYSDQYPFFAPFSEVETRAVRGLVDNQFLSGYEVTHIMCSLSWHSYGGEVIHPMGHATANGLNEADRPKFDTITDAFANATGYQNTKDTWPMTHYDVYGDSDDWLYKERNIFAITVESYSDSERQFGGPTFYPTTSIKKNIVVNNNVQGAMAFLNACCEPGKTLKLLNPKIAKKLFELSFESEEGVSYTVEYNTSLTGKNWGFLTNTMGTGEIIRVEDPVVDEGPARFYRLRRD